MKEKSCGTIVYKRKKAEILYEGELVIIDNELIFKEEFF